MGSISQAVAERLVPGFVTGVSLAPMARMVLLPFAESGVFAKSRPLREVPKVPRVNAIRVWGGAPL